MEIPVEAIEFITEYKNKVRSLKKICGYGYSEFFEYINSHDKSFIVKHRDIYPDIFIHVSGWLKASDAIALSLTAKRYVCVIDQLRASKMKMINEIKSMEKRVYKAITLELRSELITRIFVHKYCTGSIIDTTREILKYNGYNFVTLYDGNTEGDHDIRIINNEIYCDECKEFCRANFHNSKISSLDLEKYLQNKKIHDKHIEFVKKASNDALYKHFV